MTWHTVLLLLVCALYQLVNGANVLTYQEALTLAQQVWALVKLCNSLIYDVS